MGKIDKKFMVYLILNIIIVIIINLFDLLFLNSFYGKYLENILLNGIINFCPLVLLGIPELLIRKKYLNKKEEKKEEKNAEIVDNKIVYLYNKPNKPMNCKAFWLLVFLMIVYYLFDFAYNIFFYFLEIKEFFIFMIMVYLWIFLLCFKKIKFYKHQYLSIIIIILMGTLRNFDIIIIRFHIMKYMNILYIIIIIFIFPVQEPLLFYNLKNYMQYKYYSPYFICFLFGLVNIIISIIEIIFYYSLDLLEEIKKRTKGIYIFILICKSILKATDFFLKVLTINNFSVFHIIIFISFNDFINNIFRIFFEKYSYDLKLIVIITFSFEIFAIFVFVEIIELNFCGLSTNLKKNIIDRSNIESNLIIQIKEEEEDENEDNNLGNQFNNGLELNSDSNSEYL